MLSKMAQPNNSTGGGGGRRAQLSLGAASGGGNAIAKLQQQQLGGSNGRSNSPQNSNVSKLQQPMVSLKKTNYSPAEEKKSHNNGVSKSSTNGKEKVPQNNDAAASKEQKQKEKLPTEKKEQKVEKPAEKKKEEQKPIELKKDSEKEAKKAVTIEPKKVDESNDDDVILVAEDSQDVPAPSTPTAERKSSRKAASQQKSPSAKTNASPASKKQPQSQPQPEPELEKQPEPAASEDVDMESLTVDASPIKGGNSNAQPAATSTPGRSNLFGFRGSKQTNEVAQPSSSPASAPVRTFAQISGRRSIRPLSTLTPSKVESYRSLNNELDISSCTNASMNATVGSEIPNNSSFSFSFFGRGRKRERTPPLVGSQSANDLAQDMELSPPKRARFDLFSLNLASPFSMLRSRFSKASISSPARLRLEQTPPNGEEEAEGEVVQNVSGIVIEEEEQQLNISQTSSSELTVGQEAGLETPKKAGTPVKDLPAEEFEGKADKSAAEAELNAEVEGGNRSRCSIM